METLKIVVILLCLLIAWVMGSCIENAFLRKKRDTHSKIVRETRKEGHMVDHNKRLTNADSSSFWKGGVDDAGIVKKINKRMEEKYNYGKSRRK